MTYRSAWQRDCLSDRRSGFLSDEEIKKISHQSVVQSVRGFSVSSKSDKGESLQTQTLDSAGEISACLTHPKKNTPIYL